MRYVLCSHQGVEVTPVFHGLAICVLEDFGEAAGHIFGWLDIAFEEDDLGELAERRSHDWGIVGDRLWKMLGGELHLEDVGPIAWLNCSQNARTEGPSSPLNWRISLDVNQWKNQYLSLDLGALKAVRVFRTCSASVRVA